MHDLEQRIRQWRSQLAGQLKCRPEVLDELESHLREELDRSLAPALDQAWEASLAKLGDPRALAEEFAKVTPPIGWLPARCVALGSISIAPAMVPVALLFARGDPLLVVHVAAVLLGYLATLFVGALGICFAVARPFSAWHAGRSRSLRSVALPLTLFGASFTGLGIGLGMQWAQREWGWAWSWDSKEVGALAVVVGNLILAGLLAWRGAPDRLLMAMALVNNVVVCLAWFHPLLGVVGPEALHAYGWSAFAPVLIAALVLQVALVVFVAIPANWLRQTDAA
jgi:hypothetical protein